MKYELLESVNVVTSKKASKIEKLVLESAKLYGFDTDSVMLTRSEFLNFVKDREYSRELNEDNMVGRQPEKYSGFGSSSSTMSASNSKAAERDWVKSLVDNSEKDKADKMKADAEKSVIDHMKVGQKVLLPADKGIATVADIEKSVKYAMLSDGKREFMVKFSEFVGPKMVNGVVTWMLRKM